MSIGPDALSDDRPNFACIAAAWQAHEAELRQYLRHRWPQEDEADDVLQDVFVKAMRQGQGFCSLDNPRAWLFQVARNALVDRLRARRATVVLDEESLAAPPDTMEPEPIDALGDCVTRTLPELAPPDAAILLACDLQGQTVRAYAEQAGISLAAAKARLLRARQRLRERITTVCRVRFEQGRVCGHDGRDTDLPLSAASPD